MSTALWNDLLDFDGQLQETERQVHDNIRAFCDKRLMPGITEGTQDIHSLILGPGQTGLQAFS